MKIDKKVLASTICEATDASGYEGKRWGLMANSLHLYFELVQELTEELAKLGFEAHPVALQGQHETCRLEGKEIIIVVERIREGDGLAYDTCVDCPYEEMKPVIARALDPVVKKYAATDYALITTWLRESKA